MPSPQANALRFFVKLIDHSLKQSDTRASVNALLQFGEYLTHQFPGRTSLEAMQEALQPFAEDFSDMSIPNSLILNAISSARNHMMTTPPEGLSEDEVMRWDVTEMSLHWKQQLSDLLFGCYCYFSLLDNRGNEHEERNKTEAYREIMNQAVRVLEEQAKCAAASPQGLVDVDETATLSPQALGRWGGGYSWNDALLNALYDAGIRDIRLLTNYHVGSTKHVSRNEPDPTPSRYLLIQELLKRGFRVRGVLTHHDTEYNQGPGAYYLEHISAFEIKIAESEPKPEDERYQPMQDEDFLAALEREREWKNVPHEVEPTPKADGYRRLLLSLAESLPADQFKEVLKRGFVFIDDLDEYAMQVKAVQTTDVPETSLITILCKPSMTEQDYHHQFLQLTYETKAAHQATLNAALDTNYSVFSRQATKLANFIQLSVNYTPGKPLLSEEKSLLSHGKSLLKLAEALRKGDGIPKDLDSAWKLSQLAIVCLEDDRLREEAQKQLSLVVNERIKNPQAAFDVDERIHAAQLFEKVRQNALIHKDAIVQYRLALSYEIIANTYVDKLKTYAQAASASTDPQLTTVREDMAMYRDRASALFTEARDFALRYQKLPQYEAIANACVIHKEAMMAQQVELHSSAAASRRNPAPQ